MDDAPRRWLEPDPVIIIGALTSLLGYFLPWFKKSSSYDWAFSGWAYADLSTGGGWTLLTVPWLLAAAGAGLWAGRSSAAAMTAVVGGVGGLLFASAVVAASFATLGEQTALNPIANMPFNLGLPVLAGGLGLLLAAATRAITRTATPTSP